MKISKAKLLNLSLVFTALGLGLMAVSTAERQLYLNIDNASHYMESVKLISSGSEYSATLRQIGSGFVEIETPNFILSKTGLDDENRISTGFFSSILGGIKNKIEGDAGEERVLANIIFGGSGNSISGHHNVILGGESNKIEAGRASVILGGKKNETKGNYNVVLGSNNKIEDGTGSTVVGNNSYVKGDFSAALGSGSKVEAKYSFLRNDGFSETILTGDNLFVIMAKSGMVINSEQAHNYAKLTLGGPLIISSRDTDANIKCGEGEGGGILKMVNTGNQACLCGCDGWSRNSMLGKGNCTKVCNQDIVPVCGDVVTKQISGSPYYFSGSCNSGKVVEGTGAYLVTKDNKVHRSCQTDDGQIVGCSGFADNGYRSCGGNHATGHGVILGNSNYISMFDKERIYTDNQNPGICEWTCNTGNNFIVNDARNKCICPTGYQLSEDGQSCELIPEGYTQYICTGGYEPGDNTENGDGNPTAGNEPRKYNSDCHNLGHCEWCCPEGTTKSGHNCIGDINTSCLATHFNCDNGGTSSNQKTGDKAWTWTCGENDCKQCREDLGYHEDAYGECVSDKYNVCRNVSYFSVDECARAQPETYSGIPKPDRLIRSVSFQSTDGTKYPEVTQPIHRVYMSELGTFAVYNSDYCNLDCKFGGCVLSGDCNPGDIFGGEHTDLSYCTPRNGGEAWMDSVYAFNGNPTINDPNDAQYVGDCQPTPKCGDSEYNNRCAVGSLSGYDSEEHTWYCSNSMGSVKCQSRYTICPYGYSLTSDGKCQFDSIKLCARPLSKETMVMQCTVLGSAVSAYAPEVNGSERCCGDPSRAGSGLPTSSWSSKLDWWGHEGREDCNSGIPLFTFEGEDWQKGLYYLEPLGVVSSCDGNYADEIVKECRENVHHFNNNDPYDNGYIITDCDNLRDTQYRDRVAGCYPEVVQL